MKELEAMLRQSLEDQVMTRAENKLLKAWLKERNMTTHELGVARSILFDIARDNQHRVPLIVDWLEIANKLLLPKAGPTFGNDVFFSPGQACREAIQSVIRSAVHILRICVFTISDDHITKEIIAAHHKGVDVRVLTDNPKLYDKGSDIEQLAGEGIAVRVDETNKHMHHKFAVADKAQVITGSYNWTRSAARVNEENLLLTDEPKTIRAYTKEFDQLWSEMAVL